jgi:hypothetical protein
VATLNTQGKIAPTDAETLIVGANEAILYCKRQLERFVALTLGMSNLLLFEIIVGASDYHSVDSLVAYIHLGMHFIDMFAIHAEQFHIVRRN